MKNHQVLVAIKCLVYNHEPYLRDCLEGFVMQKTTFPFVAVVHDDASTDRSAEIIKEYAKKYPDIFQIILQPRNLYSQGISPTKEFVDPLVNKIRPKYIALCEGDDYWTDPYKLQKQVDFLETHDKCSLCFSNVVIDGLYKCNDRIFDHLETRDFSPYEILEKWTIPTCTVMYRNKYPLRSGRRIHYRDIFTFLQLAQYGTIHCINEIMGCYRRHSDGLSSLFLSDVELTKRYVLLSRQYEYMFSFFSRNRPVSIKCKEISVQNCNYVIYNKNSCLKNRFECVIRKYRLKRLNVLQLMNLLYVYVAKPYIKKLI